MNDTVKSFVSGGAGGVSLVVFSHPFDLIKTRLQTQFYAPGTSFLSGSSLTLQKEGIRGLYRGAGPVLIGTIPVLGLFSWSFEAALKFLDRFDSSRKSQYSGSTNTNKTVAQLKETMPLHLIGLAGSFTAVATSPILGPAERIKILLQTSTNGFSHVLSSTIKQQGCRALLRGTMVTFYRDFIGSYVYFVTYHAIMRSFDSKNNRKHPLAILFAGGMSGITSWLSMFPIDTIKSRYQRSTTATVTQITRETMKNGYRDFYKGLGTCLLRAFPASGGFFLGLEISRRLMDMYF